MRTAGTRRGAGSKRAGIRAAAALITILCAACTSPGLGASTAAAPSASARTHAPVPTVDPNATPDPARVADLMDDGLGEGEAIFAALTQVNAEETSPLAYRITQSYPTGNSAEMTVTLTPDQTFDPDAAEPISATYTETAGDFEFRLEYFIAYEDMPDDVEAEIRGASAATDAPIALAAIGPAAFRLVAAEKSGVQVVAEGIVSKLESAGISKFIRTLDLALGTKALLDKLYKALKAGLSVKDAVALGDEHDQLMEKIDKLEDCAENPTNPVTRRGYESDPSQKQRILDRVAEVRVEIKSNIAVMFLGLINSTGSGLTGGASKVLGFIIGPATNYIRQELSELNQRYIEELEKLITDCDGFTLEFVGRNLPTQYVGPFDLVGEMVGCPEDGGGWRFTGTYTISADEFGLAFEAFSDDGWLLDMKGGQTPESVELVLGYHATVEQQASDPEGIGSMKVTDALEDPSAVATVYDALGNHLGDYPLEVTAREPNCEG